jgi:hypothetical protein
MQAPRKEMINAHKILLGKVEQEGNIVVDPRRKYCKARSAFNTLRREPRDEIL